MTAPIRVAVIGLGNLGKAFGQLLPYREDFIWVAAANRTAYCYTASGLSFEHEDILSSRMTPHPDAAIELLKRHGDQIDAVFLALPNAPTSLYPDFMRRVMCETGFEGVFVDALKRSESIERLLNFNEDFRNRKLLYITGAGVAPGLLTTVAGIAALTFVEVLDISIHLGIQAPENELDTYNTASPYIHVEGYEAKRLASLSPEEMALELECDEERMSYSTRESADDIILELAGVCPRDRVRVTGLVVTRSEQKAIPTSVTITGRTLTGNVCSHRLSLSPETQMLENTCGSALGFMLRGVELYQRSFIGLISSADLMPRFSRQNFAVSQPKLIREELDVLLA
jgi:hypothetical protein